MTVPVPLTDIEAGLDPQRGHRAADVTNDEALALIRALRIAVEGLDRAAWLADDQRTEAAYEECHERLAAVRELVDLGEEP